MKENLDKIEQEAKKWLETQPFTVPVRNMNEYNYRVEAYEAGYLSATKSDEEKEKVLAALREAIGGILKEPYGCPMCDSGVLRNKDKEHWDDCPFLIAQNLMK